MKLVANPPSTEFWFRRAHDEISDPARAAGPRSFDGRVEASLRVGGANEGEEVGLAHDADPAENSA
jgi:hypothetical protein